MESTTPLGNPNAFPSSLAGVPEPTPAAAMASPKIYLCGGGAVAALGEEGEGEVVGWDEEVVVMANPVSCSFFTSATGTVPNKSGLLWSLRRK